MAELVKDQMLEDEMAKDEMVEGEVDINLLKKNIDYMNQNNIFAPHLNKIIIIIFQKFLLLR